MNPQINIELREESWSITAFLNNLNQSNIPLSDFAGRTKEKFLDYYTKVIISQSIIKPGYVVDCMPFNQQPGVINLSPAEKMKAEELNKRNQNVNFDDSSFDFKVNECRAGEVGILRPKISSILNNNENGFTKYYNNKPIIKLNEDITPIKYNDTGYAYVTSEFLVSSTDAVFVVLGVGNSVKSPIPEVSTDGLSHSLNQLWWLTTYGGNSNTVSLETGWIASNYFTSESTVSFFAFSTPDGYNNGEYDYYNNAGDFISYSGAPTLGSPMSNFNYMLSYQILPNNEGYQLSAFPYSNYQIGQGISIGYYPMSRYSGTPDFQYFQIGSEVFIEENANVQMSGNIYGWADQTKNYDIKNSDFILNTQGQPYQYTFDYFTQSWGNNYMFDDAISFGGSN
jgi:hypothetical protein